MENVKSWTFESSEVSTDFLAPHADFGSCKLILSSTCPIWKVQVSLVWGQAFVWEVSEWFFPGRTSHIWHLMHGKGENLDFRSLMSLNGFSSNYGFSCWFWERWVEHKFDTCVLKFQVSLIYGQDFVWEASGWFFSGRASHIGHLMHGKRENLDFWGLMDLNGFSRNYGFTC